MIRLTPNLCRCLAVLLFAIILQGCGKPGYWKNEEISKGKRSDMHELNDKAVALIKKGDIKNLESLLSKEMIDNINTDAKVRNMGHALVVDSFKRFDEYYANNKYIGKDTIKSGLKNVNAYSLFYPAVAREMYFMLFVQAKNNTPNKQIITLAYAKYSYGWKICYLDMQPYGFNGKSAQELYTAAKKQYSDGQLIDALNNSSLAVTALRPADVWVYNNEPEVYSFYNKVMAESHKTFKFPMPVEAVPTLPKIIALNNKTTPEGSFPLITYITKVKLKDTAAMESEHRQIRQALSKLMPGIDKNNRYIYYLAYNEEPTRENYQKRYDMVDKLW